MNSLEMETAGRKERTCVAEKAATSLLNLPDYPMDPECQSRTRSPAGLDLGSVPAEAPCWACVESWGCGDSGVRPAPAALPQPGSDSASSPGSLTETTLELNVPGLRLSPAPTGRNEMLSLLLHFTPRK